MFADVTSANVVGYATKNCPGNTFMHAGAQFESIEDGQLLLDKTMSGLPGADFDDEFVFLSTAPHIQVVKDDGIPDMYYYLNDGWYPLFPGDEEGDVKPGWCDSNGNIADLRITPGSGFWLKNAENEDLDMQGSGQVTAAESSDITAPANIFSINANVYPIAINLNNADQVEFPDIVGADFDDEFAFLATSPHIQVVKADGIPDMYYYLNDGWYPLFPGDEEGDVKPGWCDSNGNIVDLNIVAQGGFWVKAVTGAFTLRYKK